MNFNNPGILEIDGERVGVRVRRYDYSYGCVPIIEAELINCFGKSNSLAKSRLNVKIEKVIFNDPATIVIWSDNTKTIVKCQPGDTYSKELGLAMCISKKFLGNKGNFNEEFKKWLQEDYESINTDIESPLDIFRKALHDAFN